MGKSTTNLAEKFPQLSLEWHPILNGVLTPCDVSPSGKMKVWWQCKQCNEPADKVFIARKVTLSVLQKIIATLEKRDGAEQFVDRITSYLNTKNFQNTILAKNTYAEIRRNSL